MLEKALFESTRTLTVVVYVLFGDSDRLSSAGKLAGSVRIRVDNKLQEPNCSCVVSNNSVSR